MAKRRDDISFDPEDLDIFLRLRFAEAFLRLEFSMDFLMKML